MSRLTKNIIAFSITLLFISNLILAQKSDDELFRLKPKIAGQLYLKDFRMIGTEFLFDEWKPGEIILSDGQIISYPRINFNALTNDLIYAIQKNLAVTTSKFQVSGFTIQQDLRKRKFILRKDFETAINKGELVFYEVLYDGILTLYAYRNFKIKSVLLQNNPFKESVFYTDDKFYVLIGNQLIKSPQSKSAYYTQFEKPLVKKTIRSNNLSISREKDLIKFVELLDTQITQTVDDNTIKTKNDENTYTKSL